MPLSLTVLFQVEHAKLKCLRLASEVINRVVLKDYDDVMLQLDKSAGKIALKGTVHPKIQICC